MNQKRLMKTKWFRSIALVLAFLLALPSALANVGTISAAAAEEAVPARYGDIDGDGEVTAADALEALRSAAKLAELSEAQTKFGNVDGENEVTSSDALLILQYAAKLITKFPVEDLNTLPPRPTTTPTPEPKDRPTAPPQTFDENNVKASTAMEVVASNGAVLDESTGIWVMAGGMKEGIEVANPIKGNEAFAEDYGYLRKATAADGKKNPWDLVGSELGWNADDGKEHVTEHSKADPLIYNAPLENQVDYNMIPQKVAPEGGHAGLSMSFWLKTKKDNENAPILTFYDRNYTTVVSVNGSVNYGNSTLELDKLDNANYTFLTKAEEWHYYTVTFANDWITFYMDGYEIPFEVTNIGRGKIGYFNDGFLTRYNTGLTWTEDDYANNDWRGYLEQQKGSHKDYKSITNDEYTVFGNTRFRGTHSSGSTGAKLLLTHMMSNSTKVYIGGANTEVLSKQAKHGLADNTQVAGLTYNLEELNAAQVFANYTKAAENKPGETAVTPAPVEGETEATPLPEVNLTDGRPFNVKDTTNADVTTDSKGLERYTFKAVADPEEAYGVEFENLFDNEEEKEKVRETIDSALEKWKTDNNAELFPAGTTASLATSNHTYYNNYFDVYHGDLEENPARLERDGKNKADDATIPHTQFHRPSWTKGASIGFWFKPTQAMIDSSNTDTPIPIMTMYATNSFAFEMEADGSLCFVDLNNASWDGNRRLQLNQWCHNSFMTKGDPSKIHADEWNYYTVTFANDWIQVYVNGEELIYTVSGLRKQGMKEFNAGFMSKYNPIGLMVEGDDDPHDYIKNNGNGTDQFGNYGGITKNVETLADYQQKNSTDNDDASIRATGVYEKGYYTQSEQDEGNYKYTLLLDALTTSGAKFYMGGCQTGLNKELGWGIEGSATKRIRYTDHLVPQGIQFADVRFFEDDLTAAQAQEAYEKAKARMGEETGEEPGPQPGGDGQDEAYVANRHSSATLKDGIYTFTKPVAEGQLKYNVYDSLFDETTAESKDQYYGVELKNPFVENADAIRQTVEEALAGQDRVAPDGATDALKAAADTENCSNTGLEQANGNSGDTYNGTKYQKPVWTKGASVSFWYKPMDLDDKSPILFMTGETNKGGAFGMLSDGSVLFTSLCYADWNSNQIIGTNQCENAFSAIGDASKVKEGEWNYYTVTFANDWIQVYINGEPLVYDFVNLRGPAHPGRKYNLHYFNAGFMTRYNPIGQVTEDTTPGKWIEKNGGLATADHDNFLCSIRAKYDAYKFNGGYMPREVMTNFRMAYYDTEAGKSVNNQIVETSKVNLMMDLLTDESMKMYIGGAPSMLSTDGNPAINAKGYNAQGRMSEGQNINEAFGSNEEEAGNAGKWAFGANHSIPTGPEPDFWFNSQHNQEGSSFADFAFEARELKDTEVKAAYDALTKDPEGNAIAQ